MILQKGNLDGIVRGFTTEAAQKVDMSFSEDVSMLHFFDTKINH